MSRINESRANGSPTGQTEGLSQQIQNLLAEPFAEENQLGELSLDSIEYLLEETKQLMEKEEPNDFSLTPTLDLEESFKRCLEIFCSILLELETLQIEGISSETLLEIRESQHQTRFIPSKGSSIKMAPRPHPWPEPEVAPEPEPEPEQMSESPLSSNFEGVPLESPAPEEASHLFGDPIFPPEENPPEETPPEQYVEPLETSPEEEPLPTAEQIEPSFSPESQEESSFTPAFTKSEIIATEPSSFSEGKLPPVTWETEGESGPHSMTKESEMTQPKFTPMLEHNPMLSEGMEAMPADSGDFPNENPHARDEESDGKTEVTSPPLPFAVTNNNIELEVPANWNENEGLPSYETNAGEAPKEEMGEPEPAAEPAPSDSTKPRESAYRRLGEILENELLPKHADLADKSLNKMISLVLCGELEERCQGLLDPMLTQIWSVREALVTPLLRPDDRRFEFHPQLRAALEDLGTTHAAWLYEGKLPYAGILSSLKYLMSTQDRVKYRPTPIDYGMVLLLFGQDETMGGFLLQNHLEFACASDDVTEIAFRLFRVHKMRQRALNIRKDFSAALLDTMREDVWNVIRVIESHATR